jgi:ATP/maltotriose-dependent transcriptional regulator MalT
MLRDSADRGVAIVVAPAGFGKSEAIRDTFGSTAHYIAPSADQISVETIARLLIEAVEPRSRRAFNELLQRADSDEHRVHLASWCATKLLGAKCLIILEDFERIAMVPSVLQFVERLMDATLPIVQWVIASRVMPQLPLATWLARNYMALPITASDLAFDLAEGSALARAMKVDIDTDALTAIVAELGAWPLALGLAFASWHRTREIPNLRLRTHSLLFSYLESEVWRPLSESEQQFLLAAAALSHIHPTILVAAGYPDAGQMLSRLESTLLLLSRLDDNDYRLHDLFRQFARERLKRDPLLRAAIYTRLAVGLESAGLIDEAIGLYQDAENWDDAIGLLSRYGVEQSSNGNRAGVAAVIQRFPGRFREHPVLAGLRGCMLLVEGSPTAENELRYAFNGDIEDRFRALLRLPLAQSICNVPGRFPEAAAILREAMSDVHLNGSGRLIAAGTLAYVAAMSGDEKQAQDALAFCLGAIENAPAETRARLYSFTGRALVMLQNLSAAEEHAKRCLDLARSLGLDGLAAVAHGTLILVAHARNDFDLMLTYAQATSREAASSGAVVIMIYALGIELRCAAERGDHALHIEVERRLAGHENSTQYNRAWTTWYRAMLAADSGNDALALELLERATNDANTVETNLLDSMRALLLARTNPNEATRLLKQPEVVVSSDDFDGRHTILVAQSFRALISWFLQQRDAQRRLDALSTPDVFDDVTLIGCIKTICQGPRRTLTNDRLLQVTETLVNQHRAGYARMFRRLLAVPEGLTNPLTPAETDMLRQIRLGGTTDEIAIRLGKSSNTVLAHVRSTCSKLGCSGRAAAVAHAVAQGWID